MRSTPDACRNSGLPHANWNATLHCLLAISRRGLTVLGLMVPAVWGTLFGRFWKRKEAALRLRWEVQENRGALEYGTPPPSLLPPPHHHNMRCSRHYYLRARHSLTSLLLGLAGNRIQTTPSLHGWMQTSS